MSVRGSIFPCELSKTYEETIHHLSHFVDPSREKEIEKKLLERIDVVKFHFLMGGSLTHESTKKIIAYKKVEKSSWKSSMEFKVFTSRELAKFAKEFQESSRTKEGWIISQWVEETKACRPHQMPIFVEKCGSVIRFVTLDTRMNWEGIRNSVLDAFLPFGCLLNIYVNTSKRQHDWTACSHLSLDDLRQLDKMSTEEFYRFHESTYSSMETDRQGKWKLIVSAHLPIRFMRMVQNLEDLKKYETAESTDQLALNILKKEMREKNPEWTGGENILNNRLVKRYHKNVSRLIEDIIK